ncbi:MAG: flagellar basal body-associated FliL family protein [Bacillota bacterium]
MESKSTFFILITVVAILTLSLAALAGYIFIVQGSLGGGGKEAKEGLEAAGVEQEKPIPKEEDLIKIPLFGSTRYFNLKNVNSDKTKIIQANVTLKCYKTLKNNKKANVEEMVAARSEEIQELIVRFFMTLTEDEVKDPAILDRAKEDLTNQINALMNEGVDKPEDVVYKVIFSEWLFQ